MKARTNLDIIRVVKKWQAAGHVHELTCRIDSRHDALVPAERNGKVILCCTTCGTAQELIPEFVLQAEDALDKLARSLEQVRLLGAMERQQQISRVLWSYAAATLATGLIGGLLFGPAGSLIGVGIGAVIGYLMNRGRH